MYICVGGGLRYGRWICVVGGDCGFGVIARLVIVVVFCVAIGVWVWMVWISL